MNIGTYLKRRSSSEIFAYCSYNFLQYSDNPTCLGMYSALDPRIHLYLIQTKKLMNPLNFGSFWSSSAKNKNTHTGQEAFLFFMSDTRLPWFPTRLLVISAHPKCVTYMIYGMLQNWAQRSKNCKNIIAKH